MQFALSMTRTERNCSLLSPTFISPLLIGFNQFYISFRNGIPIYQFLMYFFFIIMFLVNVINLFGVFTIILSMILNPAALVYRKRFKSWNKNTNFNNFGNWVGYERNCSKNIYSFPSDMDLTVILVPPDTTLSTKQIILPRQGHLVFQKGSTVLFNSPLETCDGTGK